MTAGRRLRILLCGVAAWPAVAAADLELAGTELQINSTTVLFALDIYPSVAALPSGDFVVTWSENIGSGSDSLRAEVMLMGSLPRTRKLRRRVPGERVESNRP
jgi:hypothetical protein